MRKRPSLEALAANAQRTTLERSNAIPLERDNVGSAPPHKTKFPHMSLYLSKPVQRAIKEIALEYDRKPHDVLIEAVELVLQRYGRPSIAELMGK